MIITVTPAPSLDRTYRAMEFELGRVNRATSSAVEASGKGVNVSRALAAAGIPTVAVLPLGGAEGRQLADLLAADSIPYRDVDAGVATRTNTTLSVCGLPTTKMNAPALRISEQVWDELLIVIAGLLTPGDWVLCAGTVPAGAEGVPARLVALATSTGARSAIDGSGTALAQAVALGPDLLAPNHLELAELVGADASGLNPDGDSAGDAGDEALISAAASWSARLSAQTGAGVLATLGASGAVYTDAAGSWHAIAPPVVPVNTVGAGDALLAGFLSVAGTVGWQPGLVADPGGALATAVAWGTSACAMPETAGDAAAGADVGAVVVRPAPW